MNLLMQHQRAHEERLEPSQLWGADDECQAPADAVDTVLTVNQRGAGG